jgi:hypothetical protein
MPLDGDCDQDSQSAQSRFWDQVLPSMMFGDRPLPASVTDQTNGGGGAVRAIKLQISTNL